MAMRVTFIPHCNIDDEYLSTRQFQDDAEGKAYVRKTWDEECDEGLNYRAEAEPRIAAFEAGQSPDSGDHLALTFACDYGYVIVDHWPSATVPGLEGLQVFGRA
jgi:hypothetical protein